MAMSQDQIARLMSSLTLKDRMKAAGLPAAKTKEESRVLRHIDSQNTTRIDTGPTASATVTPKGIIAYGGAPKTLEESGLAADGFVFDDSQIAAVHKLIHGRHVALIGQAGTGKTTMVKHALATLIYGGNGFDKPYGIRQLSGNQGPSIAVCAFTGIASQVVKDTLPTWLAGAVKTIHQLLEYKPLDPNAEEPEDGKKAMFIPTRDAKNKLDHDIIILDESSMVGLDLWHNLIDALRPGTRIILIGDLNQLKPVGDATFFAYALSAAIDGIDGWSIAELTTIHRQKEPAANAIIDAASAILNGKTPTFDNPKDPNWRVMGYELSPKASLAHDQILQVVQVLGKMPTPGDAEKPIFDPYKDLLLTAGNGEDINDSASFVQQIPLNGSLSRLVEPPTEEHPLFIIEAGRADPKRFAVGHRVMATKNESPDTKDRVTNGLTGRITSIRDNPNWNGNKSMFGTEKQVLAFRAEQAKAAMNQTMDLSAFSLASIDTSKFTAKDKDEEKQSSHIIEVKFRNGAERTYRTSAEVAGIQLAYAITVHKAQGSQADTVIVVVHQAVKRQLSREWLYTAVTRAKKRLVILYTPMALSVASARQQIYGANLREKVNRYRQVMQAGNTIVRLKAAELSVDYYDSEEYDDASEA